MGSHVQQVNSQSQAGSTGFHDLGSGLCGGSYPAVGARGYNGNDPEVEQTQKLRQFASGSALEKESEVEVHAHGRSNAQGQSQIVQSDYNYIDLEVENEVEEPEQEQEVENGG